MKPFHEYIEEANNVLASIPIIDLMTEEEFNEDSAAAVTGTGGVANADAKPIFKKEKVFGHKCISVDDDTYSKCIQGKQPFARWANYVSDPVLRNDMKNMFQRNKKMLIKNSKTGSMSYIR